MKRRAWRPEKVACGSVRYTRIALDYGFGNEIYRAVKQCIMLHRIVGKTGQLTLIPLVFAAMDMRIARIVLPAVGRGGEYLITR